MFTLKAFLPRLVVVAAACGFIAVVGCQNPDEFYRFGTSGGAGSGTPGAAGDTGAGGNPQGAAGAGGGPTGTAGTTGAAGTGVAGTTGVAGSGPAGTTGAAGTTGVAGTTGAAGAGGRGGGAAGTGAAGAGGRGGGAAGTTGAGGRGGAAGSGTAGRGGAAGGGTAGRGGSGAGGAAGRGADRIQVVAKCGQDGTSTSAISVTIKIYNLEASDKQWGDIKVRYYFTSDGMAPIVEFDYLANTVWNNDKTNLVVTPTGSYVEIGFKAATAGTLFAFDNIAGSGDMQMRIHPMDYHATWNPSQADDPSFTMCAGTAFAPRMGIAGFYMGQLAWGTTP